MRLYTTVGSITYAIVCNIARYTVLCYTYMRNNVMQDEDKVERTDHELYCAVVDVLC